MTTVKIRKVLHRQLRRLLVDPDHVAVTGSDNGRTWITDRYIMIDAGKLIGSISDAILWPAGPYRLRATGLEPSGHDWMPASDADDHDAAAQRLADATSRLVRRYDAVAGWERLTVTAWTAHVRRRSHRYDPVGAPTAHRILAAPNGDVVGCRESWAAANCDTDDPGDTDADVTLWRPDPDAVPLGETPPPIIAVATANVGIIAYLAPTNPEPLPPLPIR